MSAGRPKNIVEDIPWFKLENYSFIKKMEYDQLAVNIKIRMMLWNNFNVVDKSSRAHYLPHYWELIKSKPLFDYADILSIDNKCDDNVKKRIFKVRRPYMFSDEDLLESQLEMGDMQIRNLKKRDILHAYDNQKPTDEPPSIKLYEEYPLLKDEYRLVSINVDTPKPILVKQFEQWLSEEKSKLPPTTKRSPEKIRRLVASNELIPFVDLKIWSTLENKDIKQRNYCEMLFPGQVFAGHSTKLKYMNLYLSQILSFKTIRTLNSK